tara:strand:- start:1883 stop:2242 length:360 start_codon:yes stop_codon:yes gene_type:complete
MNTISTQNKSKNTILILSIFVCVFLFSFSGYSQNTVSSSIASSTDEVTANSEVKAESARTSTNMEFVQWFMGTKQDPNSTISTEGINTKKQIMTSGIAPNRLLIKAFLKKAVNFESALA